VGAVSGTHVQHRTRQEVSNQVDDF
jgi:hypothetical protein